jgi:hypothetical protein
MVERLLAINVSKVKSVMKPWKTPAHVPEEVRCAHAERRFRFADALVRMRTKWFRYCM